jgi:hypothetical protein
MEKFGSGIQDGKNSDSGSGINIPDPQHCIKITVSFLVTTFANYSMWYVRCLWSL